MPDVPDVPDVPDGPGGDFRVGYAERDRVIDTLKAHTAAGRLTLGEFSDRADAVVAARSSTDLERVTADLPPLPSQVHGPMRRGRWAVALLGDSRQKGRWRPAARNRAIAVMGDVRLDFRTALCDGPAIEVSAVGVMGDVVIIVPRGMTVELSGVSLLGDRNLRLAEGPDRPGLPILRVRAVAVMGDVTVRT